MIQQQPNKYLATAVQTASPAQLMIMLYDGAIRFCRLSIAAIKENNLEASHTYLIRVQDIINEFVITLDKKAPIAESLLQLYEYFNFRLAEANSQKAVEPVEEVMGHLTELKSTWVEAAKIAAGGRPSGTGAQNG